jgi:uncharacterized membrane protein YqaE (UPF0057 family)
MAASACEIICAILLPPVGVWMHTNTCGMQVCSYIKYRITRFNLCLYLCIRCLNGLVYRFRVQEPLSVHVLSLLPVAGTAVSLQPCLGHRATQKPVKHCDPVATMAFTARCYQC